MKAVKIILICLCVLLCAAVVLFVSCTKSRTSQYYFEKLLISPIPESVSEYNTLRFFDPTLGEGDFLISFKISTEDFNLILNSKKWEKNSDIADTDLLDNFKKVFKEGKDNMEFYHYKPEAQPSAYGELWMISNKEHNKVIIRGQI